MSDVMTRGRDGDLYPDVDPAPEDCHCRGTGWCGEDQDGRPRPCLTHRPHLRGAYGPSRVPAYSGGRFRAR